MKRILLLICFGVCLLSCYSYDYKTEQIELPSPETEAKIKKIYQNAQLTKTMPLSLFRMAMLGFYNIKGLSSTAKLVVVDFSKPSTKERLYVIDVQKEQLLYQSLVAHGKNSGNNMATDFSNVSESKKSSLGFYLTGETYSGKHGYSLRLDGIEKGINHNARARAIVMHGAEYVSKGYVQKSGRLGRSWGCPALPSQLTKPIIEAIKNKSCLFIYANEASYLKNSKYILK